MAKDTEDTLDEVEEPEDEKVDSSTDADGTDDDDGADDEPSSRSGSGSTSDRSSRANAFSAVRELMGDTLRGKGKDDASDDDQDEDDLLPDEDDDEANGDEDRSSTAKGTASDREKPTKGGDAGDADDDEDGDPLRYEIVDEKGDTFALDLPEKAKIRFPADGRTIEVQSVDELVALAQKGAAFDRVSSTAGQERATLRGRIAELQTADKENEELMFKLLFDELDEETREKLQKELEPYRNPTVREGLDAKAKLEEREKSDQAADAAARSRTTTSFWKATEDTIGKELPSFEYLDAEDTADIKVALYSAYTSHLNALAAEYVRIAPEHGVSKEDAIAEAQRDAAQILNVKTLHRVMKDLDQKYAKRAGRGRDVRAETNGKREVDRHNSRVEDKRQQRRDSKHRSMRGGGTAVSGRETARDKKPVVGFENRITASLRRMRRTLSTSSRSNEDEE